MVANSHGVERHGAHNDRHRIGLARHLSVVVVDQGRALDRVARVEQQQIRISGAFLLDQGGHDRQALVFFAVAKEIPIVEVPVKV